MSEHFGRVVLEDYLKAAEALGATILWDEVIKPGDMYLAGRNTGIQLLTCRSVNPKQWINPIEEAYPYDTWECVKISV